MSFRLTIVVPDTKLTATLKQLNGHKVTVENMQEPEKVSSREIAKTQRRNGDTLLTMTGKMPQKNSQLAKAREIFEKLEKRVGIGTVTKKAFKDELKKKKLSPQLAVRCITEKVVAYV